MNQAQNSSQLPERASRVDVLRMVLRPSTILISAANMAFNNVIQVRSAAGII